MIAARRELETRKNQIKPEDDPFWEKRGGKGERLYPKYSDVAEKPLKDNHGNVVSLPPSSRLLVPTKAAIRGTYHKEEDTKNSCPLPISQLSHLLTPTKASVMGEYHTAPASPSSIRATSASGSTQPLQQPAAVGAHSPTLLELTVNRRAAAWEKKPEPEMDPREEGWKNILHGRKSTGCFQEAAPVPVARHNEHYKDVKSKLYQPTIASSHQMWVHSPNGGDEDCVESNSLLLDEGSDHHSEALHQPSHGDTSFHGRYANICSRLHDPTAATKAARWSNRVASPPPRRQSMGGHLAGPPEVEGKMTKAQQYGRREKFVRVDSKDLQEIEKSSSHPHRHHATEADQLQLLSRSASAPVFGRIFVPVYTPIATRAQLTQRLPRSLSPARGRVTVTEEPPVDLIEVPAGGLELVSGEDPETSVCDDELEERVSCPSAPSPLAEGLQLKQERATTTCPVDPAVVVSSHEPLESSDLGVFEKQLSLEIPPAPLSGPDPVTETQQSFE
jgi:hypothetical protein